MKEFYQYKEDREAKEIKDNQLFLLRCREGSMIALLDMLEKYVLLEDADTKGVVSMLAAYIPVVKKTFEDYSGDLFAVAEKAADLTAWHKKNAPPSSVKMDS